MTSKGSHRGEIGESGWHLPISLRFCLLIRFTREAERGQLTKGLNSGVLAGLGSGEFKKPRSVDRDHGKFPKQIKANVWQLWMMFPQYCMVWETLDRAMTLETGCKIIS